MEDEATADFLERQEGQDIRLLTSLLALVEEYVPMEAIDGETCLADVLNKLLSSKASLLYKVFPTQNIIRP